MSVAERFSCCKAVADIPPSFQGTTFCCPVLFAKQPARRKQQHRQHQLLRQQTEKSSTSKFTLQLSVSTAPVEKDSHIFKRRTKSCLSTRPCPNSQMQKCRTCMLELTVHGVRRQHTAHRLRVPQWWLPFPQSCQRNPCSKCARCHLQPLQHSVRSV